MKLPALAKAATGFYAKRFSLTMLPVDLPIRQWPVRARYVEEQDTESGG
jgi:hypothetical protein